MASEYTPNYNLDLYADNDKPNLRDQYNGAITKVDAQLHELSNNLVIVTEATDQAKNKAATAQSTADSNTTAITDEVTRAKAAEQANAGSITKNAGSIAKNTEDILAIRTATEQEIGKLKPAAYLDTTPTVVDSATLIPTSKAVYEANSVLAAHFPIKSDDIVAGAITRDKLDAQALESLIKGITIRRFDNSDSTADNTGLVVPNSEVRLAGFYLPELTMLVITIFHVPAETTVQSFFNDTTSFRLPSYVPHTTANNIRLNGIGVKSNSSSDFVNWTGIGMNKNGYIGTNSGVASDYALDMAGSAVVFLRAYGVA
jgi:hypothetical protein